MKVKLKVKYPKHDCREPGTQVQWTQAAPFVLNPRGILIHRVKRATTYISGSRIHTSVDYWCGGGANLPPGSEFLHAPPANRLVCSLCEAKAVYGGERPSDELAGRHVHKGRVRAERTCCNNEGN